MAIDMTSFEAALETAVGDDQIVRNMIRLQELAVVMFGAICDHADDLSDDILDAAEDWYSYLVESAEDL